MAFSSERPHVRKLARALKHLDEIKDEIDRYTGRHPYVAIRDRETYPNPRIWTYRARLAMEPGPDLAVMIGDCVHNLRGTLNHLSAALVPTKRKRQAKFVIVHDDIWAIDPGTGEHISGAADQLRSWSSSVKDMHPDAARAIKAMQPYTVGDDKGLHPLAILNALDNADKYYELTTVDLGIKDPVVTIKGHGITMTNRMQGIVPDGDIVSTFRVFPGDLKAMTDDQAFIDRIIDLMADGKAEMDVEITGEPQIGMQFGAMAEDHFVDVVPVLSQLYKAVEIAVVFLDAFIPPDA
jgi:hypothetical protein